MRRGLGKRALAALLAEAAGEPEKAPLWRRAYYRWLDGGEVTGDHYIGGIANCFGMSRDEVRRLAGEGSSRRLRGGWMCEVLTRLSAVEEAVGELRRQRAGGAPLREP